MTVEYTNCDAVISKDRLYRYKLVREWDPDSSKVAFIGLNPSTADDTIDDPTIRRCVGFAQSWGFGGFIMLNLFAFRATNPEELAKQKDPIGPENNAYLLAESEKCDFSVACWGTKGTLGGRDVEVRKMIPHLHYIRLTKDGHPSHPLYLPSGLDAHWWGKYGEKS